MLRIFLILFLSQIFLISSSLGESKRINTKVLISKVYDLFNAGEYEKVSKTLILIENRVKNKNSKKAKEVLGLVSYWKAMALSRMNEFEEAEKNFIKALDVGYFSKDIYYEYGQVLYVSNKYRRARVAFKKSVKAKYKMGVSLYYIAFISQELKDYKKAVGFYNMIERLPEEEKQEVVQAARMQIGDIYLMQVEKQRDPFKQVEKYVIPQYENALSYDKKSALASKIKEKIENLQRKYELILFKMRNGKPTARPPHYFRANVLYGINDNVTAIDEDSKSSLDEEDYSSSYYQAGFFSRYSFYPNSSFSYAPEVSGQLTQYSSDSENILPYNAYYLKTALKMNYEHLYKKLPATFYIDIDYTYNADDADADESFAAADNTYGITFSEELQIWANNPSTFRFRYESVAAEEETDTNSSMTLSYEQVLLLSKVTLFFSNSYAITEYPDSESSNTTSLTNRVDAIFPTFYKLFNPTLYLSHTLTEYTEDTDRGTPSLITYGMNLNRPVGKNLYLTVDASMASQTADEDTDNYNQNLITLNLDYIY